MTVLGVEQVLAAPTARDISRRLYDVYRQAALKQRLMAGGRSYLAPIELILDEIPTDSTILDMGCGNGFLLSSALIWRRPARVVGVDVDNGALAMADEVLAQVGMSTPRQLANLFEWDPPADETFDVVALIDVIHHVPLGEREGFLAKVFSRVKPGGKLIYKDIAMKPWWGAAANFIHDLILAQQAVRLMPVAQVEMLAEKAGLRCGRREKLWRLWYPHELRIFERPKPR